MTAKITNGKITVGRTIKTGDYENKRFDVELSFTIPEEADGETANYIGAVGELAMQQMNELIGAKELAPKVEKSPVGRPPKPPKVEKIVEAPKPVEKSALAVDPSEIEDPGVPSLLRKEVAAQNAKAAEVVDENDISGLMGGGEAVKEITDKELQDAAQKCMDKNKNAPAIHKALRELGIKQPPGRIIDLPQEKRQAFLDALLTIKPLA